MGELLVALAERYGDERELGFTTAIDATLAELRDALRDREFAGAITIVDGRWIEREAALGWTMASGLVEWPAFGPSTTTRIIAPPDEADTIIARAGLDPDAAARIGKALARPLRAA